MAHKRFLVGGARPPLRAVLTRRSSGGPWASPIADSPLFSLDGTIVDDTFGTVNSPVFSVDASVTNDTFGTVNSPVFSLDASVTGA